MEESRLDRIIRRQEIKNERNVSFIRMALALTGIIDVLAYFGIIDIYSEPLPLASLITNIYLLSYSSFIFIILLKKRYYKNLKFVAIILDYLYVYIAFLSDPNLSNNPSEIVWYAFAGSLVFYLINLLRYSREGTIMASLVSTAVYIGINLSYHVDPMEIFQVGMAFGIILLIGYTITSSNRKMMAEATAKQMMERYLAPELVTELYSRDGAIGEESTKLQASILFADIRSFSAISEQEEPVQVVNLLNRYLSMMTDVIFEERGTIDKYIGDAIMTIFGAPIQKNDDALRAVRTAVKMHRALERFNAMEENQKRPLNIGIGVHSGEVIAGNIGSERRVDYTVIGDTVNLASRIEGLCKFYRTSILISQSTKEEMGDWDQSDFILRELDSVIVMGRSEAITVYQVLDLQNEKNRKIFPLLKNQYEKGLDSYRHRQFQKALDLFSSIKGDFPSQIMKKRCQYFLKNPPRADWKGNCRMDKK